MYLSVATANLFFQPFDQVLAIIAEAGFQNIELDLFWQRKGLSMAQHLRDVPIRQAVRWIEQSGLRISSIHDGSGMLETGNTMLGFINPALDEYLDCMGYAPDCLVFHTPHIEGDQDTRWWEQVSNKVAGSLEPYRHACSHVTIENLPALAGYSIPLTTPEELNAFTLQNGLSVTFDTSHYAQMGTDIIEAAGKLEGNIKTVHLSDYAAGRTHVYIGEGELNLSGFFEGIDRKELNTVTLECSLTSTDNPGRELSYNELVGRMREARIWLEHLL